MPTNLPLETILNALERAARFRRQQVTEPTTPVQLANDIEAFPGPSPIRVGRNGWAKIGTVLDGYAGACILAVWWHPATDRVKIERPPRYAPPEPASMVGDPLYRTNPVSTRAQTHLFTARPGFIYTYQGVEYNHEDAERLTAKLGSIAAWTWRPE